MQRKQKTQEQHARTPLTTTTITKMQTLIAGEEKHIYGLGCINTKLKSIQHRHSC